MTEHKISLHKLASVRDGTGHSIFGASGAAMFLHCAGSLVANLLAPDNAGYDAAWGTVAHSLTEEWAKSGKKPKHLLGRIVKVVNAGVEYPIEIDREMFFHAKECVDRMAMFRGLKFYEMKVGYSAFTPIPGQGGTADFVCIQGKKLIVLDHKFGKGHTVYAYENPQLMLYALGVLLQFWIDYDIEEVELHILQPRKDHFDVWVTTPERIFEFAHWAKKRMALAWTLDAPRTPGEKQCEWCKVKATCAAHVAWMRDVVSLEWDAIDMPVSAEKMLALKEDLEFEEMFAPVEALNLSTEDLGFLLKNRRVIESWFKKAAEELSRRIARGDKTRYWKLVQTNTHRVVPKNRLELMVERAAEHGIPRKQVMPETPVTPATFEKLLRAQGVDADEVSSILTEVAIKPPGGPTLALSTDKRPALADVSEGIFDDLHSTDETDEW